MGFRFGQRRRASEHATCDGQSRWRRDGFDQAIHTIGRNSSFHAKRGGPAVSYSFNSALGWFAIRWQYGSGLAAICFAACGFQRLR